MIQLDDPDRPVPSEALTTPGGFAWWYVEVLDERGDGVVAIVSWGLPFLPGLASAARRGQAVPAITRPSITLVAYRNGREAWYQLAELRPDQAAGGGAGPWRFGDTTLSIDRDAGVARLDVDMTVPVGQSRLRGTVTVHGAPTRRARAYALGEAPHYWTPLLAAQRGRVDLASDDGLFSMHLDGHGYVDRNWSLAPLHELGIARWAWGHTPTAAGDRVWYVLDGVDGAEAFGVAVHSDGAVVPRALRIERSAPVPTRWGLRRSRRHRLFAEDAVFAESIGGRCVDLGPFYGRWLGDGGGSTEVIDPQRIDLWQHRALVRMRVSHADGHNSRWHALFCGPRAGRVQRLLGIASGDRTRPALQDGGAS